MTQILKKDILTVTDGIIIHGVNCQKVMGAGLARSIRSKYPCVFAKYVETKPKLGFFDPIRINEDLWVGNCYTQDFFGRKDGVYVDYNALTHCLHQVKLFSEQLGLSVHSPIIGSGLGGGNRDGILRLYSSVFDFITLYEL
jgi:hypothetical protein